MPNDCKFDYVSTTHAYAGGKICFSRVSSTQDLYLQEMNMRHATPRSASSCVPNKNIISNVRYHIFEHTPYFRICKTDVYICPQAYFLSFYFVFVMIGNFWDMRIFEPSWTFLPPYLIFSYCYISATRLHFLFYRPIKPVHKPCPTYRLTKDFRFHRRAVVNSYIVRRF